MKDVWCDLEVRAGTERQPNMLDGTPRSAVPGLPSRTRISEIFTVTADNDLGPASDPTMIEELKRLMVLPVAFALFLCAAQASVGMSWRGASAVSSGTFR